MLNPETPLERDARLTGLLYPGDEERTDAPARTPVTARQWLALPLALAGLALVLRVVDIFVLRLDELFGEIILSKSLGFALVVGYVWWIGRRLSDIGFHTRHLAAAVAVGGGITVLAFLGAGVAQLLTLAPGGTLIVAAVDPKTGLAGGVAFAVLLIVGNVINSFMEEGLFRGVMLNSFLRRLGFWPANLLQASLFAAWHLVWPLKALIDGDASTGQVLAQAGTLVLGTFVAGLVYGYLYWRTGSLWAPWVAHFINNTTLNLIQVRAPSGELMPAVVMSVVVVVVLAFLAFAVGPIARRLRLASLEAWPRIRADTALNAGRSQTI